MTKKHFEYLIPFQIASTLFILLKLMGVILNQNSVILLSYLNPILVYGIFSLLLSISLIKLKVNSRTIFLYSGLLISFFSINCVLANGNGVQDWILLILFCGCYAIYAFQLFFAQKLSTFFLNALLIFNFLLAIFAYLDWRLYLVTKTHLSIKYLAEFWRVKSLFVESATHLGSNSWVFIFEIAIVVIFPFIASYFVCKYKKEDKWSLNLKTLLIVPLFLFVSGLLIFNPICSKVSIADYVSLKLNLGLLPLPLHPRMADSSDLAAVLDKDYRIDIDFCYGDGRYEWGKESPEKIVFIFVESLRSDAFQKLMPGLKKVAENGLLFKNHFSLSNISLSSFYSVFHSNFPINIAFSPEIFDVSNFEISANRAGYKTGLIGPSLKSSITEIPFWGRENIITTGPVSDFQSTEAVLNKTFSQLKEPGKAIYLSYLYNMHFNYYYPPEFERFKPVTPEKNNVFTLEPTPENRAGIGNRYKNAALWADDCLTRFFDKVKKSGLDKKTVFIILGDHGESLGESGFFGHSTGPHYIQFRVPLIVVGGGIKPEVVNKVSNHMNIIPIIAKYLNLKVENTTGADELGFPVVNIEESVLGRILVRHEGFMNIFDADASGKLYWIALMGNDYSLTGQNAKLYNERLPVLATLIESDLKFLEQRFSRK